MKKAILLIGEGPCGKTTTAKIISECFNNPGLLLWKRHRWYAPSDFELLCKCDCIIFEDVPLKQLDSFFNFITDGIPVSLKADPKLYTIHPQIIITCNSDPADLDLHASFTHRFNVIKMYQWK